MRLWFAKGDATEVKEEPLFGQDGDGGATDIKGMVEEGLAKVKGEQGDPPKDAEDEGTGKDDDSKEDEGKAPESDDGKEAGEDKPAATDDGIKSVEDAVKMHKDDQRYITELQQKNKELADAMTPLMTEVDGKMVIDPKKVEQMVVKEDESVSPDDKKRAIENFWSSFDKDPITTLFKIVADSQRAVMQPYEQDLVSRSRNETIDDLHESKYKEYGDLREQVKDVLKKDNELASLPTGKGVELAYNKVVAIALPEILKAVKEAGKKPGEETSEIVDGKSSKDVTGDGKKTTEQKIQDGIMNAGGGGGESIFV